MDTDDPIRQVLAQLDRELEITTIRARVLTEVRDMIRRAFADRAVTAGIVLISILIIERI